MNDPSASGAHPPRHDHDHDADTTLFAAIRRGAATVASRATLVHTDHDAIDRLAATIDVTPPQPFVEERWSGPVDDRIMGIVAWNAVNFGSGWFPELAKLPGRSGARTLATHWRTHCASNGVPDATWLADVDVATVATVFGQRADASHGVHGLLVAFTTAWRELGQHLLADHDGSATALVESADGSAERLATSLAQLPSWDDRHRHGAVDVPLYKRAQIVTAQLAANLDGHRLGRFHDLGSLTSFADNLVPHVLRHLRVLTVDDALADRIEREELLTSGERAEVELRAVAVHAIETLGQRIAAIGRGRVTAATLDHRLWQQGQDPAIKARPRHRCRCTFY